jgi:hypothetical protein
MRWELPLFLCQLEGPFTNQLVVMQMIEKEKVWSNIQSLHSGMKMFRNMMHSSAKTLFFLG